MNKEQLFKRWQELWNEENIEVEYEELTAVMLEKLVNERCKAAVSSVLDQALNSGDGSYRP